MADTDTSETVAPATTDPCRGSSRGKGKQRIDSAYFDSDECLEVEDYHSSRDEEKASMDVDHHKQDHKDNACHILHVDLDTLFLLCYKYLRGKDVAELSATCRSMRNALQPVWSILIRRDFAHFRKDLGIDLPDAVRFSLTDPSGVKDFHTGQSGSTDTKFHRKSVGLKQQSWSIAEYAELFAVTSLKRACWVPCFKDRDPPSSFFMGWAGGIDDNSEDEDYSPGHEAAHSRNSTTRMNVRLRNDRNPVMLQLLRRISLISGLRFVEWDGHNAEHDDEPQDRNNDYGVEAMAREDDYNDDDDDGSDDYMEDEQGTTDDDEHEEVTEPGSATTEADSRTQPLYHQPRPAPRPQPRQVLRPASREGHAAAELDHTMILFGGFTSQHRAVSNDLWQYTPPSRDALRENVRLQTETEVRDRARGKVVDDTCSQSTSKTDPDLDAGTDCIETPSGNWCQIQLHSSSIRPRERYGHTLTNIGGGKLLTFGGMFFPGYCGETNDGMILTRRRLCKNTPDHEQSTLLSSDQSTSNELHDHDNDEEFEWSWLPIEHALDPTTQWPSRPSSAGANTYTPRREIRHRSEDSAGCPLSPARGYHAACYDHVEGMYYVFGGISEGDTLADLWILNVGCFDEVKGTLHDARREESLMGGILPELGQWKQVETKGPYVPSQRMGCTAHVIGDKLFLVGGGNSPMLLHGGPDYHDVYCLPLRSPTEGSAHDLNNDSLGRDHRFNHTERFCWSSAESMTEISSNRPPVPSVGRCHASVTIGSRIVVHGGSSRTSKVLCSFDTESGLWWNHSDDPMAHQRSQSTGSSSAFGGSYNIHRPAGWFSSNYCPNRHSLVAGVAPSARFTHTLTCLGDGRIACFGGYSQGAPMGDLYVLSVI
eukprot:Clim_evm18s1 gene=Clim_evmTU18s1